ncbi:MAG: cytochrome [Hyphomicrobiales bacterium]|jgi:cytochrome c556|nr:cytochrome [Hyphomicrobiales bacterium]
MIRGVLVAGALIAGLSSVMAQSDPIAERQQVMKKNNQEIRTLTNMLKGAAPFELDKVQATLKGTAADYKKVAALFPATSQTGGETRALPKIWTDKPAFDASMAKLISAAESAQVAIKDEASFKTEFPKVSAACDACHDTYRAPRK